MISVCNLRYRQRSKVTQIFRVFNRANFRRHTTNLLKQARTNSLMQHKHEMIEVKKSEIRMNMKTLLSQYIYLYLWLQFQTQPMNVHLLIWRFFWTSEKVKEMKLNSVMEFRHVLTVTKRSMLTYMFLLFDQINFHAYTTKYLKPLRRLYMILRAQGKQTKN
jgi:hypothetical protein